MMRAVIVLALAASMWARKRSGAELVAQLAPTWVREPSARLAEQSARQDRAVGAPTWVREPRPRLGALR